MIPKVIPKAILKAIFWGVNPCLSRVIIGRMILVFRNGFNGSIGQEDCLVVVFKKLRSTRFLWLSAENSTLTS